MLCWGCGSLCARALSTCLVHACGTLVTYATLSADLPWKLNDSARVVIVVVVNRRRRVIVNVIDVGYRTIRVEKVLVVQ